MVKRKTNYSSDWEKQYIWMKMSKKMLHLLFANYVTKLFWIDGGGMSQVISHASGHLHLQHEQAGQNQSTISLNPTSVGFFHQKSQLSKLKYC